MRFHQLRDAIIDYIKAQRYTYGRPDDGIEETLQMAVADAWVRANEIHSTVDESTGADAPPPGHAPEGES